MQQHCSELVYEFSSSGLQAFKQEHDVLVDEKAKVEDEDVQGILSKARGYVARTAMILHCLEEAVNDVLTRHEEVSWKHEIGQDTVQAAAKVITHLNCQKIMMGKDAQQDGSSSCRVPQGNRIRRLLTNVIVPLDCCINPSVVGQKHISERVGSSYPVSKALELEIWRVRGH